MSAFLIRSSAGGLVSLLNDEEVEPYAPTISSVASASPESDDTPPLDLLTARAKRKFKCQDCGKSFTTSGHLTRHAKVHSGEKEWECPWPGCDKRTARHDNLLQHYRMHLPKPRRKEGNSYIRAVMGEMRAKMEQMDRIDQAGWQGLPSPREAESPDVALRDLPAVRQQPGPAPVPHTPRRSFVVTSPSTYAPRAMDLASLTLTSSSPKGDYADYPWTSARDYSRYAVSNIRGQ